MKDDRREVRIKTTYNLEALEELVTELIEASSRGAAVIVEGMRDRDALRALGVTGPIFMASRRPALDLAEGLAKEFKEIVVLTDWDDKGDEMAVKIEQHLRHTGSKTDMEIRSKLKKLVKKEIKDVESLNIYVRKARELYGA